jgi:hypothetical protein
MRFTPFSIQRKLSFHLFHRKQTFPISHLVRSVLKLLQTSLVHVIHNLIPPSIAIDRTRQLPPPRKILLLVTPQIHPTDPLANFTNVPVHWENLSVHPIDQLILPQGVFAPCPSFHQNISIRIPFTHLLHPNTVYNPLLYHTRDILRQLQLPTRHLLHFYHHYPIPNHDPHSTLIVQHIPSQRIRNLLDYIHVIRVLIETRRCQLLLPF